LIEHSDHRLLRIVRADSRSLEVAEYLQADGAARPAHAEVCAAAHERAVALQPSFTIRSDGKSATFAIGRCVAIHAWIDAAIPVFLDAMPRPRLAVVTAHAGLAKRPKHDLATFRHGETACETHARLPLVR